MANQAIALQARAPQAPSLSGVIQQNAMLINQAMQAQAAQRQSQAKQQEMQLAREKGTREASDAQIKYAGEVAKVFKEELAMLPPGDVRGAEALRRMTVERVPGWDAILPSADAIANDKGTRQRLLMKADEIISYSIPKPTVSVQFSPTGKMLETRIGGTNEPGAYEMPEYAYVPDQPSPPPTASVPASAPPPPTEFDKAFGGGIPASPEMIDAAAEAIARGAGVNDPALKDLTAEQFNEANLRAGRMMLAKPISAEQSGVEPLTLENAPQIVQAALDSGFIDPVHVEQLKQMLPPENQAAVDQWVRQSGLKMGKGVPGAQSAVYRPQQADFGPAVADDGMAFGGPQAPMGQQIGYVPTGRAAEGKNPMQSPTPGQYNVPLPVVRGRAGAEEGGKQDVRVVTDPKIEAGKARAVRLEKLRGEMPVALSQSQTLVNDLTDRIKAIDDFLRNPYRNSIIGSIEGRIPRALQSEKRADAQAQFDYITNNTVLDKLISDRQSTETGASPQGIVSDTDLKVAAQAATKLTRTGSERAQEIEMQRLRDVLYRTREQAIQKYNNVYREVLKDAPELRIRVKPVTPRYKAYPNGQSQGKKVGQFIVTEVRD